MIPSYDRSRPFSDAKIGELRRGLAGVVPSDCIVATFGSYARREASEESDIDYLVISGEGEVASDTEARVSTIIREIVRIDPSTTGPFAKSVAHGDFLKNLGGDLESNHSLTRRLLLMLEGEYLSEGDRFRDLRSELIEKYVDATPKDHQLALFLLNDIIRYWRTMTVDYMYKTAEASKPWAIRNIKLIFSRKLLYASGLFAIGATVDKGKQAKIDLLTELFDLTPIDRLVRICGRDASSAMLRSYGHFLEEMEKPSIRTHLKGIKKGDHEDRIFRDLKNGGHAFTRELLTVCEATFHSTHPIHRAVIF